MPLVDSKEKELLTKLKDGDHEAFRFLYDQYAPEIYIRIRKLLGSQEWVEEIHQDVFLKIWESRSRVDEEVPFKAILYRTAKSLVIDFYRKAIRDQKLRDELVLIATEYANSDFIINENDDLYNVLYQVIDKLPPQRKRIFSAIKLERKRYDEVASEYGISVSTVKDHMAKAMIFIRSELNKESGPLLFLLLYYNVQANFL